MISETLRCKLALLLYPGNLYLTTAMSDWPNIKRRKELFQKVFLVQKNTVSDKLIKSSKLTKQSMGQIIKGAAKFREAVLTQDPGHPLKFVEPISLEDLSDTHQGEEYVIAFARKLGFYKFDQHGSVKLRDGHPEFHRLEMLRAIDGEYYCKPKPGCGMHLSSEVALEMIQLYAGVYAVYFPIPNDQQDEQRYFRATLRISHDLEIENKAWGLRVKLNMPNINNPDVHARYQYRGSLAPIDNGNSLNMTLYLVSNSIELEVHYPGLKRQNEDAVTILCSRMADANHLFSGVISTLHQTRDRRVSRYPYAAKVILKRQNNIPSEEKSVFMKEGPREYLSLPELTSDLDKSEKAIGEYFGREDNIGVKGLLIGTHPYTY